MYIVYRLTCQIHKVIVYNISSEVLCVSINISTTTNFYQNLDTHMVSRFNSEEGGKVVHALVQFQRVEEHVLDHQRVISTTYVFKRQHGGAGW